MNDRPTEATVLAFPVFSSTSGFIYLFIYFINFGGWRGSSFRVKMNPKLDENDRSTENCSFCTPLNLSFHPLREILFIFHFPAHVQNPYTG
jgi:hypothetical protein